jgi:hypothetical protein
MSIQSQAQEYVAVRQSLRYEELVAEGKRLYESPNDQREFVEAALHADIVRSNLN